MTSIQEFDCDGLSDAGKVHGINDDQFLIADLRKSIFVHKTSVSFEDHAPIFGGTQSQLLLVADGGGGWTAERQASEMAVQTIAQYLLNMMPWLYRLDIQHEDDFIDDLTTAIERCLDRVKTIAEAASAPRDMNTALTMAYINWPRLYVVNVGNCRCYLLRQSILQQITTDQTPEQPSGGNGAVQDVDVDVPQLSQILWNVTHSEAEILHPEVHKAGLQPGDVLLLCTDGLTKHLTDDDIQQCLQRREPALDTCQKLIDFANHAGGTDNITVIVARIGQESQSVDDVLEELNTIEIPRTPDDVADTTQEDVTVSTIDVGERVVIRQSSV
jgi:PPM family protein phosphatase